MEMRRLVMPAKSTCRVSSMSPALPSRACPSSIDVAACTAVLNATASSGMIDRFLSSSDVVVKAGGFRRSCKAVRDIRSFAGSPARIRTIARSSCFVKHQGRSSGVFRKTITRTSVLISSLSIEISAKAEQNIETVWLLDFMFLRT